MKIFTDAEEVVAARGSELGQSGWTVVDQELIDKFADATGDHQWIHVDPDRAATGPFGSTIAHGFLTLSLVPIFAGSIYRVDNTKLSVNYGLNRVRFVNPVRVGSRLRSSAVLEEVTHVDGGLQLVITHTVEIEGEAKPACVAETVSRVYFER